MKVLLAVGSAPCLFDDVAVAQVMYPASDLMLINGAWTAYRHAQHLLAGHTNKSSLFMAARKARFPDAPPARVHATLSYPAQRTENPDVTDWHDQGKVTGATSAGKAARIGLALGYDRVILCGCPMDPEVGYWAGEAKVPHDCPRFDTPGNPRRVITRYRDKLEVLAGREPFKSKVFSMSGFSRQVLGYPE